MDKILVIDNDQNIRESLSELFSKEYNVIFAEDGLIGVQKFISECPDLIIANLMIDHFDGKEFLQKVKEFDANIPVIIISASENIESTIESIQLGAYDFFGKPLDNEKLKISVNRALNCKKLTDNMLNIISPEIEQYKSTFKLVSQSPAMKDIVKNVGHVSLNRMNVLIQGETGTGKEIIAKLIHYSGITKKSPFVAVNCSALTESLLESELFGHVRGAFTNAYRDSKGKFELAGNGTLLLDEISEISMNTQVKLLRVLQEREFEKVGGEETIHFDARIIATTNKNLHELVRKGRFRDDLYFRLKVFMIEVPPLRERKDSIPSLVTFLVNKINTELHKNIRIVPFKVMEMLMNYEWVGNIRELENILFHAIVLSTSDTIEKENILLPHNIDNNYSVSRAEKI